VIFLYISSFQYTFIKIHLWRNGYCQNSPSVCVDVFVFSRLLRVRMEKQLPENTMPERGRVCAER